MTNGDTLDGHRDEVSVRAAVVRLKGEGTAIGEEGN
jgi:hypothetical protein